MGMTGDHIHSDMTRGHTQMGMTGVAERSCFFMEKKHGQKNEQSGKWGDYLKLTNACSTTDMTGLIPSVLTSEAEEEFYDEMYQFLPPVEGKKSE